MIEGFENILSWIEDKEIDTNERKRREAIHIILSAIANSDFLNARMAMKGGVLLAIRYGSSRYTTDVDFSTSLTLTDVDIDFVKAEMNEKIIKASEKSPYGMACRIQKFRQKPNDPKATWPTFQISIGYAYNQDFNSFKRLQKGNCSSVIKIDYSFNEMIFGTEMLALTGQETILTYSYVDLISEKYRAILQQEQRQRGRSQDVYDIYYVLTNFDEPDELTKLDILKAMIQKSESRNLKIDRTSMSDPKIIKRSENKYRALDHDIFEKLPPFQPTYDFIQNFYENLPWQKV
ncbi:nucleotidyl transferase AbiEii/AbiGii toxin family protein [uncultured Desulfobacter sp.]|uniref:nucleotidyl transferase AbiEii/AbiGii toxin family protein n=1 Tax=uncultured Desulfobacter sp. TaxID=240139 RepID=UPI0029F4FE2E|nr:nucleotidyl transferase AbiEii/AbiGii toxin family protein [uncultured Desulfobacter sp.]